MLYNGISLSRYIVITLSRKPMNRQQRYQTIISYFSERQPHTETELKYENHFQLLIAVVLSAQCTDKRVNLVTPDLFSAFPDAAAMGSATEEAVLRYISSVSYPNAKARHLVQLARKLQEDYGGVVPHTMDELLTLPGVGRKTANVMLAVAFRQAAMPVDTHVYRVSHRLGLVSPSCNTPMKVEQQLTKNIPAQHLANAHHWLLLHGRYVCKSQRPACTECPFNDFCPKKM